MSIKELRLVLGAIVHDIIMGLNVQAHTDELDTTLPLPWSD